MFEIGFLDPLEKLEPELTELQYDSILCSSFTSRKLRLPFKLPSLDCRFSGFRKLARYLACVPGSARANRLFHVRNKTNRQIIVPFKNRWLHDVMRTGISNRGWNVYSVAEQRGMSKFHINNVTSGFLFLRTLPCWLRYSHFNAATLVQHRIFQCVRPA
jgi:hypothetical protein